MQGMALAEFHPFNFFLPVSFKILLARGCRFFSHDLKVQGVSGPHEGVYIRRTSQTPGHFFHRNDLYVYKFVFIQILTLQEGQVFGQEEMNSVRHKRRIRTEFADFPETARVIGSLFPKFSGCCRRRAFSGFKYPAGKFQAQFPRTVPPLANHEEVLSLVQNRYHNSPIRAVNNRKNPFFPLRRTAKGIPYREDPGTVNLPAFRFTPD
jgi:hypothetical protein